MPNQGQSHAASSKRRLAEALARAAMNRSVQHAAILNPPLTENLAPVQQLPQIPENDLGPPVYRPFPREEYPSEQFEVDPSQELYDLFQDIDRGLQLKKLLPPQPPGPPTPPEPEQQERRPLPPGRQRMLAAESLARQRGRIDPAILKAILLTK